MAAMTLPMAPPAFGIRQIRPSRTPRIIGGVRLGSDTGPAATEVIALGGRSRLCSPPRLNTSSSRGTRSGPVDGRFRPVHLVRGPRTGGGDAQPVEHAGVGMSDQQPNIVFFFWDNFGWGELGGYGGGV